MQKTKRIIIISAGALLAVVAALVTILLLVKGTQKIAFTDEVSQNSSVPVSSVAETLPVETVPPDNGIRLVMASPTSSKISTTEPVVTFSGTSDPAEPLTMNDVAVERSEQGYFNFNAELTIGKNTFSFSHKGETKVYTVNYRFVIINGYDPSKAQKYTSGSTFVVCVLARKDSGVTAKFNGQTITLTGQPVQGTEDVPPVSGDNTTFINYTGSFTLPEKNMEDLSLGKITYTATYNGKSESFSSGNITCLKDENINYIAEVVEYNAETFDGTYNSISEIDFSRPTNNYLPKGTLDYCKPALLTSGNDTYVTLRSGQRVYLDRRDKPYDGRKPVVTRYVGTLPDHNEIEVASFDGSGRHTVLTLNCLWKAPFRLGIFPQSYVDPNKKNMQNYSLVNNAATYNYIDINFCYATAFSGDITIPADNPLFSSAEIIKNASDYTLRLHLKKQGAFYGWDSYYNDNGQLCFEFLNPAKISPAENNYNVNLSGVKILLDVGHGGIDIGASGFNPNLHSEAIQNLLLANKIKAQLESIGAEVYMTRTDNVTSSTDDKITMLKRIKPDYCLAIHHNSSTNKNANGFGSYYYHPFSMNAAKLVYNLTNSTEAGIYNKDSIWSTLQWHYYFMARVSNCPVVLTENGFMSNESDYNKIIDEETNLKKAKYLTQGIVDYFKSIQ